MCHEYTTCLTCQCKRFSCDKLVITEDYITLQSFSITSISCVLCMCGVLCKVQTAGPEIFLNQMSCSCLLLMLGQWFPTCGTSTTIVLELPSGGMQTSLESPRKEEIWQKWNEILLLQVVLLTKQLLEIGYQVMLKWAWHLAVNIEGLSLITLEYQLCWLADCFVEQQHFALEMDTKIII